MMASGLNPNARNVPISVVRADTAAYIVFMAAKMAAKAMMPATNNPSTRRLAAIPIAPCNTLTPSWLAG